MLIRTQSKPRFMTSRYVWSSGLFINVMVIIIMVLIYLCHFFMWNFFPKQVEELERSLDPPLNILFIRQLLTLRDKVSNHQAGLT